MGSEIKRELDYAILGNEQKFTLMNYKKVLFFQQISLFEGMAGLTLSYLVDVSKTVLLSEGEVLSIDEKLNNDFYIVYRGVVEYYDKGSFVVEYQVGQFIGERLASPGFANSNMVKAKEATILLKFNKDRFYELLSNHVKLADKVLEYI
ncbi:MAG: cyclic nucleotide-binding domain-containing protein [Flammeovirgaceae bacterium]|nr:cyclic nucleotide-binding domain-containing protein [Flammeovirgaceae bacterium]